MKSLKVLSLFLAIFLAIGNTGFAQSAAAELTAEQKEAWTQSMEEYAKTLKLSEEQKSSFEALSKKYLKQMVAVRDSGGGKFKKYKKVKTIRKDKNAEMKALLSEEQYEVYLVKEKEMQDKMSAQRG